MYTKPVAECFTCQPGQQGVFYGQLWWWCLFQAQAWWLSGEVLFSTWSVFNVEIKYAHPKYVLRGRPTLGGLMSLMPYYMEVTSLQCVHWHSFSRVASSWRYSSSNCLTAPRRNANVHTFDAASHSSFHEPVRSPQLTFAPNDPFDFHEDGKSAECRLLVGILQIWCRVPKKVGLMMTSLEQRIRARAKTIRSLV